MKEPEQEINQKIESLKAMVVFYTKLCMKNCSDSEINQETNIANHKVQELIQNSENKGEMVNKLVHFYGIEINYLLNTQGESNEPNEEVQ